MKKLRHSGSQDGESSSRARTTVQWHPRACPGKARSLVFTEGPAAPPAARSFASVDLQHPGSPSAPQRSLGLTEPHPPRMRHTAQGPKVRVQGPCLHPLPQLPPPHFLPGNLARQLLDPVEECVCCSPVQRLWAEQGHAPAGMATSGPLAEEGNKEENMVRRSRLDRRCLGDAGGMRTGKSRITGASPAAGLLPVEVDWPAPEVEVIVGQLPLRWAQKGEERASES